MVQGSTCRDRDVICAGCPVLISRFDNGPDRLCRGSYPQRLQQGRTVHLDRPLAEVEVIGDLLVQLAARHLDQDLLLARGQLFDLLARLLPGSRGRERRIGLRNGRECRW